jgi:hypothetical protein
VKNIVPVCAVGKVMGALTTDLIARSSEEESSSLLLEEADVEEGKLGDLGSQGPLARRVSKSEQDKLFIRESASVVGLILLNDLVDAGSDQLLRATLGRFPDSLAKLGLSVVHTDSRYGLEKAT